MKLRTAYFKSDLQTRDETEGKKYIEGYFAVFNQETELSPGYFEAIIPGAFDNSLKENDVRCLFNHDDSFVLGRTGNKTLELKTDKHGLYGKVEINQSDNRAMSVYACVKRGDVYGCSFGFYEPPGSAEVEEKENGIHWKVKEADTREVSICTFPAYPQTEIQARKQDFEKIRKQQNADMKATLKKRLEAIKC